MRKNTLLLLGIFAIAAVYSFAFVLAYSNYEQWIESTLTKYPVEVRPYADFTPFLGTFQGRFLMLSGIGIIMLCTAFIMLRREKKRKVRSIDVPDLA